MVDISGESWLRIRPARESDCDAINRIYNFYVHTSPATFDLVAMTPDWRRAWFEDHQQTGLPILVAEAGGEIAGWCSLSKWSPKPAYNKTADESIYVDDAYRGRHVGTALVSSILGEARSLGLEVVMALIVQCQEASLGLHRSLGFEQTGVNVHMGYKLGGWHDIVTMQRHLWKG